MINTSYVTNADQAIARYFSAKQLNLYHDVENMSPQGMPNEWQRYTHHFYIKCWEYERSLEVENGTTEEDIKAHAKALANYLKALKNLRQTENELTLLSLVGSKTDGSTP